MDVTAALGALEAAGSEQTRKTYRRHGAPEPMFGVSFSELRRLAKQAGTDHDLARALWATGNTDARCLAMLVADPARIDAATADGWAAAPYHLLVDLVADVVARSSLAIDRMAQWVGSSDEWIGRCGWVVMARLAQHQPDIADAAFTPYLAVIERRIHDAPNRAKQGMSSALIAIGGRSDELAGPAIAAAQRIGPIEIDHGDTDCKQVDAVEYIQKIRARAESRGPARKRASTAKPAKKKPVVAAKKRASTAKPAKKKAPPRKSASTAKPAKKKAAPAKKKRR